MSVNYSHSIDVFSKMKLSRLSLFSVFNRQLLVSCGKLLTENVDIYNDNTHNLSTIVFLKDMVEFSWTPRGQILYRQYTLEKTFLVTVSQDGMLVSKVYMNTLVGNPSVAYDNSIHVVDEKCNVYQSTNDGVTWSHAFRARSSCWCYKAIKVSCKNGMAIYWMIEFQRSTNVFLFRMYTVNDSNNTQNIVIGSDVNLPQISFKNLAIERVAFDGYSSMLIGENVNASTFVVRVHTVSIDGIYRNKLLTDISPQSELKYVAVDRKSRLLYVMQANYIVKVFSINYDD